MSLTISLVQLKRKQRANGEIPIYVRFTQNRKSRYMSTGIAVDPRHFNPDAKPENKIRKSHKRYKQLNFELEHIVNEIKNMKLELKRKGKLDLNKMKREISGNSRDDLLSFAEVYHKQLEGDDRFWEARHFKVVKNNLERFLGSRSLKLGQIDVEILEEFQRFLIKEGGPEREGKRTGNSPNTVRKKIQRLRGMIKEARKRKLIEHDPFFGFERVDSEPVEKVKLSKEQIEEIDKLDLAPGSSVWHARNYFMYSYYNAGIRFGDLCTLKWENIVDGRLRYSMNKTGSHKSIKQLEPMTRILDHYRTDDSDPEDYIFPILDRDYSDPNELRKAISSKNVLVNRELKNIAGKAGIQASLSFHIARHSFANYALKKGMDLYSISKALGHSDLKITEHYLKHFDEEKLDKDMEDIFN